VLLAKQIVDFDLSCIIRINDYPAWIFIYINKFHKFHQFLMYGNVATEMSHDRNGQTETARPNRPDRNGSDRNGSERIGQTETAQNESAIPKSRVHFLIFLKCVDVSERGRKG